MNRIRSVTIRGFTLIELMIVVAILGTLASIAVPKFADMIKKAKQASTKGNLGALRSSIIIYYASNEFYPLSPLRGTGAFAGDHEDGEPTFKNYLIPSFIDSVPACKLGMSFSEWDALQNTGENPLVYHEGDNKVFSCDNDSQFSRDEASNSTNPMLWEEWIYNMDNGKIYVNAFGLTDTAGTPITSW